MAESKYIVELELKRVGDFGVDNALKKTSSLDNNLKRVKERWGDMSAGAQKFSSALDWAAGKIGALAVAGGLTVAAAGVAGLTYGVMKLNKEAENAVISLGTIFRANGVVSTVPQGMTMARDVVRDMRKDAAKLPGEYEDLQNIFKMASVPGLQAGASVKRLESLSAKAMAAAAAQDLPMDMVAREFGGLLSGRAGMHNIFGARLGLVGERGAAFNKESGEKRLADLEKELDKYGESIEQFSHTYDAQSSTLIDNLKNVGRTATAPLFESVKTTLADINLWFDTNQSMVSSWSGYVGHKIQDAFEWGKRKMLEWYPIVSDFASGAWVRIQGVWEKIEPSVNAVGSAIRRMLEDPNGTIDKLILLAEVWAGSKLLSSGGGGLGSALMVGGFLGAGEGAGAMGAVAGVAGGAIAGAQVAGPYGAAGGALLGGLAADFAAYDQLKKTEAATEEQAAQAAWAMNKQLYAAAMDVERYTGKQGTYDEMVENWASTIEASGDTAEASFMRLSASAVAAAESLDALGKGYIESHTAELGDQLSEELRLGALQQARAFNRGDADAAKKMAPQHHGGHGGTNIQKVEIVVTSNQSPSRIARAVEARLSMAAMNRRVSPFVRNFSSREED